MSLNVALVRQTLVDLRWHIFWYGIGVAAYAALIAILFPTFEGFLTEVEYPEELLQFFGGVGELGDPAYFIQTEYYSFVPLILIIYGVISGTGMLAGDEGRGTLETLLAQPIARTTVFNSRVLALLLGLIAICALNTIGWLVSTPFVDLQGLDLPTLVMASFSMIPLVAAFAGISILLAAIGPSRASAGGLMAAVAIVSYLTASFANTIEAIEWMRWITPYYYADADRIVTEGVVWWHQLALVGLALVSLVVGRAAFQGREIGAGIWQPRAVARGWK